MGSGIERLVNTMLSLEQLKNQRAQLAQAQAAQEVGIMERLPDLLGQVQTDEERAEIFKRFAPYTRYSPENLAAAFGETPTSLQTQINAAVETDETARSVHILGALPGQVAQSRTTADALSGKLGEPLRRGAETLTATGQDIGSFTRSLLFADQPQAVQQQVFDIETGRSLSAAQQAGVEQGYAGLRIQEHLGLLNAALNEAGLQLQQQLALAQEQPGGLSWENRFQAMDFLRKIADALGGPMAKEMTPDMQAAYVLQYNDIAKQIGVPEMDPAKEIGHAGLMPSLRRGNVDAASTNARLRMLEQQNRQLQEQLRRMITTPPPAPAPTRPDTSGMVDLLQSIRNR